MKPDLNVDELKTDMARHTDHLEMALRFPKDEGHHLQVCQSNPVILIPNKESSYEFSKQS